MAHSSSQKDHWSYTGETGPEHCAELEEESDCNGKFQSPINIVKYKENNDLEPVVSDKNTDYSLKVCQGR